MINKKITLIIGMLMLITMITGVSASWYNPLSWFSASNIDTNNGAEFKIQNEGKNWVQIRNDPNINSEIKGNQIISQGKPIFVKRKGQGYGNSKGQSKHTINNPKHGDKIRVGQNSDEYVYQNLSKVVFEDDDLQINNSLRTWNGESYEKYPENIWIKESNKEFKSGANFTNVTDIYPNITHNDGIKFKYDWKSNKQIKYDSKKDYFFFNEEYSHENQHSKIYERTKLDLSDICSIKYDNSTNTTLNPKCSYNLTQHYYNTTNEFNETVQKLNYSKLQVEFTGFYDSETEMVFIDPVYSYTDVSESATLSNNIRSEADFSHLEINDSSLKGYWSFDRLSQAYDLTNNDNDGSFNGDAFVNNTGGEYGGALQLDGDGDYVEVVEDSSLKWSSTESFSKSAWIKREGSTGNNWQVAIQQERTHVGLDEGDNLGGGKYQIYTYLGGSGTGTGITADLNKWYHVVMVYDNTNLKMYVNGNEKASTTETLESQDGNDNYFGYTANTFNGSIDEVQIYDRALNSTEIQEIYNSTYDRFKEKGNQTFQSQDLNSSRQDNRVSVTADAETLNGSKLNVSILESTDNLTYTETEEYKLTEYNSTHLRAEIGINTDTEYIKPRMYYSSNDGFYTSSLSSFNAETYYIDVTPPYFTTIPEDENVTYGTNWNGVDFDANDSDNNFSSYYINDTTNFQINSTGYLDEIINLSVGNYSINVSVNDTEGNTNSTIYNLKVTKYPIEVTGDDKTKIYEEADPSLTYQVTSGSLQYDDSFTGSLDRVSGEAVGNYDILQDTLTIDDISNYDLTYINGILTIEKGNPNLGLTSTEGWKLDSAKYSAIEGVNCPSQITCSLFEENVDIGNPYTKLFPAGEYDFKYNTSGNKNYTSDSISQKMYSQVKGNETISNETEYCYETNFAYNYLDNQDMEVCN